MKKLLLASTALIGLAGAAAAEVSIEGTAEMGISGGDLKETQFHNSYTLNFVMTGETDTGLSFGATYRLDADDNDQNNQAPVADNGTVWISGAFGKLTLGDTDGALDWALTETGMGTAITDEGTTHIGYSGNSDGYYDDQVLRYEYALGDFGFAVSAEQDDTKDTDNDPMLGLGVKYKTSVSGIDLGLGFGVQSGQGKVNFLKNSLASASTTITSVSAAPTDLDVYGISASAAMQNGFSAILNYVKYDFDSFDVSGDVVGTVDSGTMDHYAVGFGYTSGPLLLTANWGKWKINNVDALDAIGANDSFDSYGLVANYDLGGGAIVAAGYASDVSFEDGDQDQFSVGLSLSF